MMGIWIVRDSHYGASIEAPDPQTAAREYVATGDWPCDASAPIELSVWRTCPACAAQRTDPVPCAACREDVWYYQDGRAEDGRRYRGWWK